MTMYNFFSGRVLDLECTNKKKSEIELFKHWNLKIYCKNLSMSFLRKLPTLFWLLSLSILYEFFWCASFFWAKKTSEHRIATDKWFLTKKNFYEKEEKMLVFSFIIIDYVCDHNFRVIIRHHFVLMDEHKSNISTHNELKRKGNSYPIFRIYGKKVWKSSDWRPPF